MLGWGGGVTYGFPFTEILFLLFSVYNEIPAVFIGIFHFIELQAYVSLKRLTGLLFHCG
jgi:hypothetical protein